MNTPSNAGKEHNPWDRKPHEYGAPEWRLLNTDEAVQIGDEYNCKDYRCEPRWAAVEHTGYLPISHTEYRRRTTPPTQSQEGETEVDTAHKQFHAQDEYAHHPGVSLEFARNLHSRLTAAQRENDRLRSEVARIRSLAMICAAPLLHHAYKTCDRPCDTTLCPSCAAKALRAATEEGK